MGNWKVLFYFCSLNENKVSEEHMSQLLDSVWDVEKCKLNINEYGTTLKPVFARACVLLGLLQLTHKSLLAPCLPEFLQ